MGIACKKVDVSLEKRILIGFIVSTDYIKKISKIYDKNYFTSHASRLIAKWCIDHYSKYNKAPDKHITDIYIENKRKNTFDEEDQDFIENILESLSDEWDNTSSSFDSNKLVDQTIDFFNERKVQLLHEKVEELIEAKNIEEIQKELTAYAPISANSCFEYINPLADEEEIREAFSEICQPLFKMPGKLGKLLNPQLYKGAFIAFQAPEKAGKSYVLQELVMRAIKNRVRVALFELGDLVKADRIRRIGSYTAKLPFVRGSNEDLVKCRIPELIEVDGEYIVNLNEVVYPMLTADDALRAGKKWMRRCGKDILRVSVHPSDTLSIADIHDILTAWRDEDGWVPEFIAIDYADIARKPNMRNLSEREGVNYNWKGMRRLSQEWNAFTATVTQADAKSYGKAAQHLKNFSEDKRKYSHITAMYAINQTLQEQAQNTYRIAPLRVREGFVDTSKHVAVVHCLDLGRPYMFSYEVDASKFEELNEDDDE